MKMRISDGAVIEPNGRNMPGKTRSKERLMGDMKGRRGEDDAGRARCLPLKRGGPAERAGLAGRPCNGAAGGACLQVERVAFRSLCKRAHGGAHLSH
jgi:hypothetical protein